MENPSIQRKGLKGMFQKAASQLFAPVKTEDAKIFEARVDTASRNMDDLDALLARSKAAHAQREQRQ